MPKFRIQIAETAVYEMTVSAATEDEAKAVALGRFVQSSRRNQWFRHSYNRNAFVEGRA